MAGITPRPMKSGRDTMRRMTSFGSQGQIGRYLATKTFRLQPRFTIVHHPVRQKFDLSLTTYAVIDSVHQLSHRPDHPWCSQSKGEIARFLDVSERQVFRAVRLGLEKGLLEKSDRGDLRTTERWVRQVVLYDGRQRP